MKTILFGCSVLGLWLAGPWAGSTLAATPTTVAAPAAKRILFLGDSITYGGLYVEYVEAFLRLQYPDWPGQVLNLGLPSETVSGLSEEGHAGGAFPRPDLHERLDRVLSRTKPDLVIACYGINDGIYLPFSPERFERFQAGIRSLRAKVGAAGAPLILLTPPTYDFTAAKGPASAASYNEVLDRYSAWLLAQRAEGWVVLDLHGPMNEHLQAHRQRDPAYRLAEDGVHPKDAGHWLMARPLIRYFGGPEAWGSAESAQPLVEAYPHGPEVLKLVQRGQRTLKDAWLTETGHQRPGMNKGLPLAEAQAQAAVLEPQIRALTAPLSAPEIRRESDGRITLACAATNVVVRYTLDGSEPTREAGAYLASIDLPQGGTVRAGAFGPASLAHGPIAVVDFPALPGAGEKRLPSTVRPVTQNRDWWSYDWPTRHAAVCRLVRERQPALVFIGDSITHFWGGEPVGAIVRGQAVWTKFYARRNALNLGFGWDRTENVLWRLRHGELDGAAPKVVVLLIGTNNLDVNSSAEIVEGIQAIGQEIHTRSPGTHILLLGILPRSQHPDERRKKAAAVNQALAEWSGQAKLTFLDLGSSFVANDGTIAAELMDDYLHPTEKGYALMAQALEPTLARLLGE